MHATLTPLYATPTDHPACDDLACGYGPIVCHSSETEPELHRWVQRHAMPGSLPAILDQARQPTSAAMAMFIAVKRARRMQHSPHLLAPPVDPGAWVDFPIAAQPVLYHWYETITTTLSSKLPTDIADYFLDKYMMGTDDLHHVNKFLKNVGVMTPLHETLSKTSHMIAFESANAQHMKHFTRSSPLLHNIHGFVNWLVRRFQDLVRDSMRSFPQPPTEAEGGDHGQRKNVLGFAMRHAVCAVRNALARFPATGAPRIPRLQDAEGVSRLQCVDDPEGDKVSPPIRVSAMRIIKNSRIFANKKNMRMIRIVTSAGGTTDHLDTGQTFEDSGNEIHFTLTKATEVENYVDVTYGYDKTSKVLYRDQVNIGQYEHIEGDYVSVFWQIL